MSSTSISETAKTLLDRLAAQTGQSADQVIDAALEVYRQRIFLEQLDRDYTELQSDPEAWAAHLRERELWDKTNRDGLEDDEIWTEDGRCLTAEGKSK